MVKKGKQKPNKNGKKGASNATVKSNGKTSTANETSPPKTDLDSDDRSRSSREISPATTATRTESASKPTQPVNKGIPLKTIDPQNNKQSASKPIPHQPTVPLSAKPHSGNRGSIFHQPKVPQTPTQSRNSALPIHHKITTVPPMQDKTRSNENQSNNYSKHQNYIAQNSSQPIPSLTSLSREAVIQFKAHANPVSAATNYAVAVMNRYSVAITSALARRQYTMTERLMKSCTNGWIKVVCASSKELIMLVEIFVESYKTLPCSTTL